MSDIDPSAAMRDLEQARSAEQEAATALMTGRLRWAALGGAVFAGAVLARVPGVSDFIPLVLVPVAVMAVVLSFSPRWGWLTGRRARLTGKAGVRVRLLSFVTMLSAVVVYFAIDTAAESLIGESYPAVAGAVVGLMLALAGPPFARWLLTRPANRG